MLDKLETESRHGGYPGLHLQDRSGATMAKAPTVPTAEEIKRMAVAWTAEGNLYAVRCTNGVSIPLNRMNLLNLEERLQGRDIESVELELSSVKMQPFTAADLRACSGAGLRACGARGHRGREDMALWYAEETNGGMMQDWMYDTETGDYFGPGPGELRS